MQEESDRDGNRLEVYPKGWNVPIFIEYSIEPLGYSSSLQLCWRVVGTEHTFRIPLTEFHLHATNGYEKHFEEVLETFRKDYLEWYKGGFSESWQRDYQRQFKNYIYTF